MTEGVAETEGTTKSANQSTGGSLIVTGTIGTNWGRGQAYIPEYKVMPGEVYKLEEQIHKRSVTLGNLRVGRAVVRVGSNLPRHLVVPLYPRRTYAARAAGAGRAAARRGNALDDRRGAGREGV